jgi:hypothetical protein
MKAWHGTLSAQGDFSEIEPDSRGLMSFCLERDGARIYSLQSGEGWAQGSKLFEVELSCSRPLDYRIQSHSELALEYLESIEFTHFQCKEEWPYWVGVRGAYQCLEHRELLLKHDFDAVYTNEGGWQNIHLVNAHDVEIKRVYDKDPGSLGCDDGHAKKGWTPPRLNRLL